MQMGINHGKVLGFIFACLTVAELPASAQESIADPANEGLIAQLQDADMDVRIAALRQLQTSLDPRLPEALLPLLSDEGNSIRRLAARAVGSRYHQIPAYRVPAYITALKTLIESSDDFEDVANMAKRAVGLLTRTYESDLFSPSPDGIWVIYERRSLPCLLDLERKNEELLGWSAEEERPGWFAPAWGNGQLNQAALWHARSSAVGMDIILSRKSSTVWIWKPASSELIQLEINHILDAAKVNPETFLGPGGFFSELLRWHGDELQFEVSFTTLGPGENDTIDHQLVMGWNLKTNTLRQVPDSELP